MKLHNTNKITQYSAKPSGTKSRDLNYISNKKKQKLHVDKKKLT